MEEMVAFCLGWRFARTTPQIGYWGGGARMKVERVGIKGWRVLTNVEMYGANEACFRQGTMGADRSYRGRECVDSAGDREAGYW